MRLIALLLCLFLLAPFCSANEAPGVRMFLHFEFKVIVHRSSAIDSMTRKELSDVFLKKTANWKNKNQIQPLDLKYENPIRMIFSKLIHQRSPEFVKNYWQQKIFAGYELPPLEKTEEEVLRIVSQDPNAIGYISSTIPLPADVKEIQIEN